MKEIRNIVKRKGSSEAGNVLKTRHQFRRPGQEFLEDIGDSGRQHTIFEYVEKTTEVDECSKILGVDRRGCRLEIVHEEDKEGAEIEICDQSRGSDELRRFVVSLVEDATNICKKAKIQKTKVRDLIREGKSSIAMMSSLGEIKKCVKITVLVGGGASGGASGGDLGVTFSSIWSRRGFSYDVTGGASSIRHCCKRS